MVRRVVCGLVVVLACTAQARRVFSHVRHDGVRMCVTPGGAHPCDCVHDIPQGSRVKPTADHSSNDVHLPNGTVIHHPKCPHDTPARPVPVPKAAAAAPAAGARSDACASVEPGGPGYYHGRPMNSYYIPGPSTGTPANFSRWTAAYSVPATPAATTNQTYVFYWIGLQDTRDASSPVLQPVLSYTGDGVPNLGEPSASVLERHGGDAAAADAAVSWYFMSWNCCPSGHKYSAPYVQADAGATGLSGEVSCADDGTCTVQSVDSAGESSSLTLDNSNVGATGYNWAIVELETYYIDACKDYCGGTFGATGMRLFNADGTEVSPTAAADWTDNPYLQLTPSGEEVLQTEAFMQCCKGRFEMGWPAQYISQN